MSHTTFNALPPELVINVLENLDYQDLLSCRQLSTSFKNAIDNHIPFQYKGALQIAGLSDNPNNTLSALQKRAQLIAYRNKWFSPFLREVEKQSYPVREGPAWELAGGVLGQSTDRGHIEFTQLPSRIRGAVDAKMWTARPHFPHVDFTMDPGQDLLVTVEPYDPTERTIFVRVLTMSTGECHPEALKPFLLRRVNADEPGIRFEIRINGPYLGLLGVPWAEGHPDPFFSVWNWKTGTEEYTTAGNQLCSFVWISNTCFMIAQRQPLHVVIRNNSASVTLLLVDLLRKDLSWTFSMLPAQESPPVGGIELVGEAARMWKSSANLGQDPSPFQIARDDRLVVLHMESVLDFHITLSFLSSNLLRVAEDARGDKVLNTGDSTSISMPWESWGPQYTRVDRLTVWDRTWPCTVYGLKHAFLRISGGSARLHVRDFNPHHVLWQSHMGEHDTSQCTALHPLPADPPSRAVPVVGMHTGDQVLRNYFPHGVQTSLPYVQWSSECDLRAGDLVMMSEDSIVVVKNGIRLATGFEIYSL
ncbi:hypothetical protein BDW22DRAFT_1426877 [Trametopsis cervina]|nr:hypothetical protein BDW22DRAFT_1426877 [Trametopsis cervina]